MNRRVDNVWGGTSEEERMGETMMNGNWSREKEGTGELNPWINEGKKSHLEKNRQLIQSSKIIEETSCMF